MTMLLNGSYAWIIGVLAACSWLGRTCLDAHRVLGQALSRAMTAGIAVCFVATLLSLWQAAATMADVGLLEAGPALLTLFATTHYGINGIVSLVLVATLGLVQIFANRSGPGRFYTVCVVTLLLLFAVARVRIGHAYEIGPASVAVVAELVHLLSMALWSGSVFVAAWVVMSRLNDGTSSDTGMAYLHALSYGATIALAGVLATGGYNMYRVLNAPPELVATQYGWILSAKICFVLLAVVLGGWNRIVGFPRLMAGYAAGRGNPHSRVALLVLRFESIVLVMVLIAAAVLTNNAPPAAP